MKSSNTGKNKSVAEQRIEQLIQSISTKETIFNQEYYCLKGKHPEKCICLMVYSGLPLPYKGIISISGYKSDLDNTKANRTPYSIDIFPSNQYVYAGHELSNCLAYLDLNKEPFSSPKTLDSYKKEHKNAGGNPNPSNKDLGTLFGCCERKIIAKLQNMGIPFSYSKAIFYCRYNPCEKCVPAIKKSDFYYLEAPHEKKISTHFCVKKFIYPS
jgi:hypothetical protein